VDGICHVSYSNADLGISGDESTFPSTTVLVN
jgi:hypothetical protein